MEPSWPSVHGMLMNMTTAQLKPIRRDWFSGCLGGASTKRDTVDAMVSQLRHWWRLPDGYGRERVRNVLRDVDKAVES